ncbi:hypothetical protein L1987_48160 [Smallanthus sonchifolius]|uniref:Uncharacterized protein n=1 Tax=Smallanthus sonchifolius TaxID=185202 RepID=A0ACB9FS39_9ASTR|nr:hypothetical protein L1987_48160 [Smallanthus sonchifolius]
MAAMPSHSANPQDNYCKSGSADALVIKLVIASAAFLSYLSLQHRVIGVRGESSFTTNSEDLGSRLPSPTLALTPSRVAPVIVVLHPITPAVRQPLFPGSTFEVGGSSTRTALAIIDISLDEEEEEEDPEDTRTWRDVQMDELVESYVGHEMRLDQYHTAMEDVLERIPELYQFVTAIQASELNRNQRIDRVEKRVHSRLAILVAFFVLLVAVVLENAQPDLTQLINQGIDAAIPRIVAQITAGLIRSAGGTSSDASGSGGAGDGAGGGASGGAGTGGSWDCSLDRKDGVGHKISNYLDNQKVKYVACSLQGEALKWWNSQVDALGEKVTDNLTWDEFKKMLIEEYCPRNELKKIEVEFWNLEMDGAEILDYTTRFQELSRVVPHLVTPEPKRIERYIWGLVPHIRGMVTSAKPTTMQSVIQLAGELTDEMVRNGILVKKGTVGNKSEKKAVKKTTGGPSKKRKFVKNYVVVTQGKKVYNGNLPKCNRCNLHHTSQCAVVTCERCNRTGHLAKNCRVNLEPQRSNYECKETGHFRDRCPKLGRNGGNTNQAKGRAFALGAGDIRQDPNVVTGTFLNNDIHASILFDTGADRSFISTEFRSLISLESKKLHDSYTIELANDLIPIELGSFDVVIGMDWLSKHRAEIICSEKIVRIPLSNGEVLDVHGDKPGRSLNIISCMKAWKFLKKGSYAFLANVVEKRPEELKIQDIPIVHDYPKVFPENLPGLPPPRQVEFRINLVPGAAPIARSPYRLAPSNCKSCRISCRNF